jgi:hypothetical protein
MRVFLATTLCVVLLGTGTVFAGDRASGDLGHYRSESTYSQRKEWAGRYERHTRAQSGRHDRGQSGWRGRYEPVHTRRASQRDR